MDKIHIRPQQKKEAQRFFEILDNDNFVFFPVRPPSVKAEKKFLAQTRKKMKKKTEQNYSILYNGRTVGAVGIKINPYSPYIGEMGYFVDEEYWGRGFATQAVKEMEKIGFGKLNLERIEIIMVPENIGSMKVAEKSGYKREGLLSRRINVFGKFYDAFLYAKVRPLPQ